MFKWLTGRSRPSRSRRLVIPPNDDEFDIVGESHYQAALDQICGGKTEDGHDRPVTASLVPEPDNPYDKNAYRVEIDGYKVGHLSREDAADLCERLAEVGLPRTTTIECEGRIVGGWDRSDSEGHYGVKLDFDIDRIE